MKKKITAIILVAIIAILCGYYIAGMRAGTILKKMAVDMNVATMQSLKAQNSPLEVTFKVVNFKNRIFSSSADLDVSMKVLMPVNIKAQSGTPGTMPPMQMPAFSYTIPLDVAHGPFIFSQGEFGLAYSQATLEIPAKFQGMLKQFISKDSIEPKVQLSVLTRYTGDNDLNVSIPAFRLESPMMQASINWLGFDNHWQSDEAFSKMTGESSLKGMNLNMQGKAISLDKMDADYDLTATSIPGFWMGDVSFNLPKVEVKEGSEQLLSFSGGTMVSKTKVVNDLIQGEAELKLGTALVLNQSYGPGELESKVKNLNLDKLAIIQQKANHLSAPGLSPEQQNQQLQALIPNLVSLANDKPEFIIDTLTMKLPEGMVDAEGKFYVKKDDKQTFKDLNDLIPALRAEVELSLPKALVRSLSVNMISQKLRQQQQLEQRRMKEAANTESANAEQNDMVSDKPVSSQPMLSNKEITAMAEKQADMQINSLLKAGLLSEKDGNYFVEIELKENQLFINDKAFKKDVFQ